MGRWRWTILQQSCSGWPRGLGLKFWWRRGRGRWGKCLTKVQSTKCWFSHRHCNWNWSRSFRKFKRDFGAQIARSKGKRKKISLNFCRIESIPEQTERNTRRRYWASTIFKNENDGFKSRGGGAKLRKYDCRKILGSRIFARWRRGLWLRLRHSKGVDLWIINETSLPSIPSF